MWPVLVRSGAGGARFVGAVLALLWLWPAAPSHAAWSLQLDASGLTPAQTAATRQILDTALARWPPAMPAQDHPPIRVEWSDTLPHAATGRARRDVLLLNRRLLPLLEAGTRSGTSAVRVPPDNGAGNAVPPDPSNARVSTHEVLATVLHELSMIAGSGCRPIRACWISPAGRSRSSGRGRAPPTTPSSTARPIATS